MLLGVIADDFTGATDVASMLVAAGMRTVQTIGVPADASVVKDADADAARGFAGKHHAVLLANHGPVVAGTSLSAAADAVEELEATAKLYLLLRGQRVRTLTPEPVAALRAKHPV